MPPDEPRTPLADAVRALRDELRETQQEFAARMGLSIGTIARYETNARPRRRILRAFENLARSNGLSQLADVFNAESDRERREDGARAMDSFLKSAWRRKQMNKIVDDVRKWAGSSTNPKEKRAEVVAKLDELARLINEELKSPFVPPRETDPDEPEES